MQLHEDNSSAPLRIIKGRVNPQSLPPNFRENVERHIENLSRLAEDLKNLGMDQQEIDDHVIEIFEQYRCALMDNMERTSHARIEQNRE